ncbi:hypothetical protein BpHYR1_000687 [Brachionus plicatilis]|uniref:Uncharacterized protein n=1 Tax=Brachionus plicatilis TaxID=10195 RepID=A0A3M7T5Y2_BRAPC|nr:hypothetical protein BpHYR1_000687 [Brachionus plicatilis]
MIVYSLEFSRINASLAQDILLNFKPEDKMYTEKIDSPKSGDLIIYWTPEVEKKKDYCDMFKWRNNGGRKPFPQSSTPINSEESSSEQSEVESNVDTASEVDLVGELDLCDDSQKTLTQSTKTATSTLHDISDNTSDENEDFEQDKPK